MKTDKIGTFCFLILLLSSCIKGGFDEYGCDNRTIRLEFDWIETQPRTGLEVVEVVFISPDGTSHQIQSEKEGREIELEGNKYEIIGWENIENTNISGNKISIGTDTNGMGKEPEEFNGGSLSVEIKENDSSPLLTVPLYQQTRPLIIRAKFNGSGASAIKEVNGVITGITESRPINSAFLSTHESPRLSAYTHTRMQYNFELNEEGWYIDRKTLLGIAGETEQHLTLSLEFIDGTQKELSFDVTDSMDHFHVEEIKEPWVITILFELGNNPDDITIVDWISGPKSVIVVS